MKAALNELNWLMLAAISIQFDFFDFISICGMKFAEFKFNQNQKSMNWNWAASN